MYLRAGIPTESLAWSIAVPSILARAGTQEQHGAYYRVTGTEQRGGYGGTFQEGEYNPPSEEAPSRRHPRGRHLPGGQRYHDQAVASALDFDMRAGDVFWMEHTASTGHVGIIVGVQKTREVCTFVTIEGNANNQVRTHVRHIRVDARGNVTADVKGWGRPPQLQSAGAPANPETMPGWMEGANEHERGGGRNTDR